MHRRPPHSRLVLALAAFQLLAAPLASIVDGWLATTAEPARAHVEDLSAKHSTAAHAHECVLCSFVRAPLAAAASRSQFRFAFQASVAAVDAAHAGDAAVERAVLPRAPPVRIG